MELRLINKVRVLIKLVFIHLNFGENLVWCEFTEVHAVHILCFVGTSFEDDVVKMPSSFCEFLWTVPKQRPNLCFV